MNFGQALEALKQGARICRTGWNGKGMWLSIVKAGEWSTSAWMKWPLNTEFETAPWIGMMTADKQFVPWLASQTDILAEDWEIVR